MIRLYPLEPVADSEPCSWCHGSGLVARWGVGRWDWSRWGAYRPPTTRVETWREGSRRKEIVRCVCVRPFADINREPVRCLADAKPQPFPIEQAADALEHCLAVKAGMVER